MNEKEKYVTPELEIIQLDEVDMLADSNGNSFELGENDLPIM